MPMSTHDREQFLAEPHVAALSVVESPQRGPLTVPVWYHYTPGGELWFHSSVGSRKARAIEAAGRVSMLVQEAAERVRYVSVEGPVRTTPGTDEVVREMAARYLPPEQLDAYVEMALAEHGEQLVFTVRPERWLSADLTQS